MVKNVLARRAYKKSKDKQQDRKIARLSKVIGSRELKYQDTSGVAVAPTWSGTIVNLFAPAEGDQDIQRAGDKVSVERIAFRCNGGMTGAGANQIRILIIRDKANSIGTTPQRVLDSSVLGTANAAQGPLEEDFRRNFEVHFDKTFMLDNLTHYQFQAKLGKTFKKPKPVMFDTNTTTVNLGQWKLVCVADQLAPNAAFDYTCRIWYSDL